VNGALSQESENAGGHPPQDMRNSQKTPLRSKHFSDKKMGLSLLKQPQFYYFILLSAKLKKRTKHLSEMPIKRHFGFVFEKVSPPTQN
jgi:hypothetical protein